MEVAMLKAIILGCAICAGAGGTVVWMKSASNAASGSAAVVSPISIQEMHTRVDMDGLPVQTYQPH
jgi:hypothetical protein